MVLSVVIPAYNERERLPKTLEAVQTYLSSHQPDSEIVVVDDGSTDGTGDWVEHHAPQVRLLRLPQNRGKGAAVQAGMLAAGGTWRLLCDADLSTPIQEYERLHAATREAPIVIGSRRAPGAQIERRQAGWKVLLGQLGNLAIQLLAVPGIRDSQCGFKLFGPAAHNIFRVQRLARFGYDFEILFIARRRGLKIIEVPVRWKNDERSKVQMIDYIRTLKELIQIRWFAFRGQYKESTPS